MGDVGDAFKRDKPARKPRQNELFSKKPCPLCKKRVKWNGLADHMRTVHPDDKRPDVLDAINHWEV